MTSLRIVFAGSPAAAVPSLKAVAASGHTVVSAITRADSPQGRRAVLTATPVATAAEELGIPVLKSNRLDAEITTEVARLGPDLGVIVAFGGLVKQPLLSTPRLGWINLHFSLLPRWRGAAPVQHAIMAGDDVTGATVFQLVPELDAGDVYGRMTQSIGAHQSAGSLLESLAESGAQLLVTVIDSIASGTARAEAQRGDMTLAPKLTIADGQVDWNRPASSIVNQIRGVTPEPGASAIVDGARLKIVTAFVAHDVPRLEPGEFALVDKAVLVGTATDPIELGTVHPAGRTAMDAASWWRGRSAAARSSS